MWYLTLVWLCEFNNQIAKIVARTVEPDVFKFFQNEEIFVQLDHLDDWVIHE